MIVAASFTNKLLIETLVIVNKINMDFMKQFEVNLVHLMGPPINSNWNLFYWLSQGTV